MNKAGAEKGFHGREDSMFDILKRGFSQLACTIPGVGVEGKGRTLDVTREKEGDGLRGSVVLNMRTGNITGTSISTRKGIR
jgi:hypothetical protein